MLFLFFLIGPTKVQNNSRRSNNPPIILVPRLRFSAAEPRPAAPDAPSSGPPAANRPPRAPPLRKKRYLCTVIGLHDNDPMKKSFWFWLPALLLAACSGKTPARHTAPEAPAAPRSYTYRVLESYSHPTDHYTQGLLFADGRLWEGTGEFGRSRLLRTELGGKTWQTIASLPRTEFGEGIALLDGKIYQLTWTSNKCYVYDAATGAPLRTFSYPGEGWGLTDDGERLYMSDGTEYLRVIDPDEFRTLRRIAVTYRGEPVRLLNELEWIDGKIWANVYTSDRIAIIDPATGRVEGTIDLTGLLPEEEITPATDVLNGIAYDPEGDRIFVTGKNWGKIFEIKIIEL